MKTLSLLSLALSVAALAGCSGSSAPTSVGTPTPQNLGPLTTRIVGAAQPAITSAAANGVNVTGIAGALVSDLTLNFQGPGTLSETKIAFARTPINGFSDIVTMNANGTGLINLTNSPILSEYLPEWSPDGGKISYSGQVVVNNVTTTDIFSMNRDGSGVLNLTNTQNGN